MPFWNTWARAPSFLFPVQMVLGAPSFPFPEHVVGPFGAPPLPFPVEFGAKKVEASRLCMQMAAEAWPIGRIGILGQTKECLLERGPYPFAAATAPNLSPTLSWWIARPSMDVRSLVSIIWRFCQLGAKGVQ